MNGNHPTDPRRNRDPAALHRRMDELERRTDARIASIRDGIIGEIRKGGEGRDEGTPPVTEGHEGTVHRISNRQPARWDRQRADMQSDMEKAARKAINRDNDARLIALLILLPFAIPGIIPTKCQFRTRSADGASRSASPR